MKLCLIINHCRSVLLSLLVVLTVADIAQAKYTVCTITINSDNEANLFKSKLPSSEFEFIEIVPERSKDEKAAVGDDWFAAACADLKTQNKSCDVVVVSGHFGGSFFGSSERRLSLETLEQMGCNNVCPSIMTSPKEVFLFGCNTLAGKGEDHRTPAQYRTILREERNEQGRRLFTDDQVDEIVAFRYSEFGHSNYDRMRKAFNQTAYIYGFDSVGPSGRNAEPALRKYLDSIPDYAAHLKRLETTRAVAGISDAIDTTQKNMNQTNATTKPNKAIEDAFKNTHFAQCSGALGKDSDKFCSLFDESKSMATRINTLKHLLVGKDGSKYLALAKSFFEKYPSEKYDETAKTEFNLIAQNQVVKDRFKATLKALEKMPTFALNLTELGEKLSFITKKEATSRKKELFVGLVNQGTIEAKDMVCSRENWPELKESDIKSQALQSRYTLETLFCLKPIPEFKDKNNLKVLEKGLGSRDLLTRNYSAWFLGVAKSNNPLISSALVKKLEDKSEYVRRMATWALYRSGPSADTKVHKALAKTLLQDNDVYVRRDAALALTYVNPKDKTVRIALEEASKKDVDEIVKKLAAGALKAREQPHAPPIAQREIRQGTSYPGCEQRNQFVTDEKSTCRTSKGIVFARIKDPATRELGWQDTTTKLVWYDSKQNIDHYDAEIQCRDKGQELPSKRDFEIAEQNGIREILKDMKESYWWSSLVYLYVSNFAYYFNGPYGGVYDGFRGDKRGSRCVRR